MQKLIKLRAQPRRYIVLVVLILLSIQAKSQNGPYTLSMRSDLGMIGVGVLSGFGALYFNRKLTPLSKDQLLNLDQSEVLNIDQVAINQKSIPFRHLSDAGLYSSLVVGSSATLFCLKSEKQRMKEFIVLSIIVGEANLATAGLTELIKNSVKRTRPYAYNPNVLEELKLDKDTRKSFISGHTSIVACNSFLFAKMYHDYHLGEKNTTAIWMCAAALPALVAYSRVRAGKHFPTDVVAGYALGAVCGVILPHLHKKKTREQNLSALCLPVYSNEWSGLSVLFAF